MKAKYTPGPWALLTVSTQVGICHKIGPFPWKEGKQNHACIYADYPGKGPLDDELLANARLIHAAPELLEAVETLLDCFVNDPLGWMDSSDIAIEKAYDAIHKAKGE
jgi:hypothetical protein